MRASKFPEERRQQIIYLLKQEGKVTAQNLSVRLNVSEDTIRRDLKDLELSGHLTRVHGGALPRSPSHSPYSARQTQNTNAKISIAKEVTKLINSDQVIFIDSGTTALEVARQLPFDLNITVITNSPPVLIALSEHPNINVILLGGVLNKKSMALTGNTTQNALSKIRADICILGVCSLHDELGVTTTDFEEAELKRVMIENSSEIIVPITADKLGTAAPFGITTIEDISHIVTESTAPEKILTPYQKAGISITKVKS
ncbi:MAG: DeoR/GlpR transcriptional regulator [Lentisphaerae bacterium]|nr:DeoR/GlpR transcriptional regulator [Lentisphaerota bacterium]MCP4100109.1 DeoR/GlpR transcriptional regulator [Lentisphaerota bacterium]